MKKATKPGHVYLLSIPVVALMGCGSVEEGAGGISVQAAPAEIAKAVCPKAYTCCMTSQLMGNDLAGTDEPSCEAKTTEGFKKNLDGIVASQKKGRVIYDGNKLAGCLSTIRSASCEALDTTNHFSGVAGCDSFVQPQVAAGGACDADWECIGGWCRSGVCRPFVADGDACSADEKCGRDLVCGATSHACMAPTDQRGTPAGTPPAACFYASACAYAGDGHPTVPGLMALMALVAAVCRRRTALRAQLRSGTRREEDRTCRAPGAAGG
jgi:hypothetical protein